MPGQELFQYESDQGEHVKVGSADINEYLREITQEDFTAKDFRTWHGTGYTAQQLTALGPAKTETETKQNIVLAVKETAQRLGNRPAACRKYYIHPAVFESYVEQTIFSLMGNIQDDSFAKAGRLRAVEQGVLRLVKSYIDARQDKPAKAS